MGKIWTMVIVCLMVLVLSVAVHAELADSGYQNVVSKSYIIPDAPVTPDFQSSHYPPITGTWPPFANASLLSDDLPDPKKVPGVHHTFSPEIIILSSKVGR